MGNSSSALKVHNYDDGKVYMFNFPSVRSCPTASPFALKLETWLRLKQIPHQTIRSLNHSSQKGQIPFIEYNGKEYNESTLIIEFLTKEFDKADDLTPEQNGIAKCIGRVFDNRTVFSYAYYRYVERPKETIALMECLSSFKSKMYAAMMPSLVKKRLYYHGIGRNEPQEIYRLGCSDIAAAARLLGEKNFMMGDSMTTVDCIVFAHLAQILYLPIDYPHKTFMQEKEPKLCEYVERIKELIWPDWNEICQQNLQGNN